jgi:hypothetical protein
MPAALMPSQFAANVSSRIVAPSLTRAIAKSIPEAWTARQSIAP